MYLFLDRNRHLINKLTTKKFLSIRDKINRLFRIAGCGDLNRNDIFDEIKNLNAKIKDFAPSFNLNTIIHDSHECYPTIINIQDYFYDEKTDRFRRRTEKEKFKLNAMYYRYYLDDVHINDEKQYFMHLICNNKTVNVNILKKLHSDIGINMCFRTGGSNNIAHILCAQKNISLDMLKYLLQIVRIMFVSINTHGLLPYNYLLYTYQTFIVNNKNDLKIKDRAEYDRRINEFNEMIKFMKNNTPIFDNQLLEYLDEA